MKWVKFGDLVLCNYETISHLVSDFNLMVRTGLGQTLRGEQSDVEVQHGTESSDDAYGAIWVTAEGMQLF